MRFNSETITEQSIPSAALLQLRTNCLAGFNGGEFIETQRRYLPNLRNNSRLPDFAKIWDCIPRLLCRSCPVTGPRFTYTDQNRCKYFKKEKQNDTKNVNPRKHQLVNNLEVTCVACI